MDAFFTQKHRTLHKRACGQSTIEFLIGLSTVFAFIFFILKITFIFGEGTLIHYATFAASRAYLTYELNVENPMSSAENHARNVFLTFINDRNMIRFNGDGASPIFRGAWALHRTAFPFQGARGDKELILKSESFLGKEPSKHYCHSQIFDGAFARSMEGSGDAWKNHVTVFDNGC